jgi:tRNA threonylcarbamoyladenosine biosynthesis protein TsaB
VNLLGFDTATAATAVAVVRADGEEFEVTPEASALSGPPRHAQELLPRVAAVLERAGLGFDDVDAVGVGVGPGTFTGLRIGIATARSLAQATGAEVRPVSSLAALAAGIEGSPALPVLDAKRGEVFTALEGAWEPYATKPEELAERVRSAGIAPFAAGDGSVRFRDVLEAAGIRALPEGSRAHVVSGLHVCRLAAAVPPVAPEALLPDYLRDPDSAGALQAKVGAGWFLVPLPLG